MTLSELLQYATVFAAGAVVYGAAFAVISHRREVNASVYLDLSDRLHQRFKALPVEARSASLQLPPEHDGHAAGIVLDFLHLMHSAYTLHQHGYFSGGLWSELEKQARRGLRLPVFRQYWPGLRYEFEGSDAFMNFVDSVQSAQ